MRFLMLLAGTAVAAGVFAIATPAPRAQGGFFAPAGAIDAPDAGVPLYFEAASVKPSDPKAAPGGGIRRQPGGRFNTFNTPLRQLIVFAYQIQGYQLVGGPDWIGNTRYDITAKFEGDPPPVFANLISNQVGRMVVDRTGLTGNWDFEMTYAPPPSQGPAPPGAQSPPIDPDAPDLFTAVREQLGLKLDATKGPVEVLVIDSVEAPAPD